MNDTPTQPISNTVYRPQSIGFIYFATNPSMPGVVKIGCSRCPSRRVAQLSANTATPTPFVLEFSQFVLDMERMEQTLHAMLDHCRVSSDREFFQIDVEDAVKAFSDWAFPLGLIPVPDIDYFVMKEPDGHTFIPLTKGRIPGKKKSLDWRYAPETAYSLKKKGLI